MLFLVALPSASSATWQGEPEPLPPGKQVGQGLQEWSARGRTCPTFAKLSKEGLCSTKRLEEDMQYWPSIFLSVKSSVHSLLSGPTAGSQYLVSP